MLVSFFAFLILHSLHLLADHTFISLPSILSSHPFLTSLPYNPSLSYSTFFYFFFFFGGYWRRSPYLRISSLRFSYHDIGKTPSPISELAPPPLSLEGCQSATTDRSSVMMQLPTQFSACRYALTCILRGSEIPLFIFNTIYRIAYFGLTTTVVHLPNSPLICRGFTRRKKCLKPSDSDCILRYIDHQWENLVDTPQTKSVWSGFSKSPLDLIIRFTTAFALCFIRCRSWGAVADGPAVHMYTTASHRGRMSAKTGDRFQRQPWLAEILFTCLTLSSLHYLQYITFLTILSSQVHITLPCRVVLVPFLPWLRTFLTVDVTLILPYNEHCYCIVTENFQV